VYLEDGEDGCDHHLLRHHGALHHRQRLCQHPQHTRTPTHTHVSLLSLTIRLGCSRRRPSRCLRLCCTLWHAHTAHSKPEVRCWAERGRERRGGCVCNRNERTRVDVTQPVVHGVGYNPPTPRQKGPNPNLSLSLNLRVRASPNPNKNVPGLTSPSQSSTELATTRQPQGKRALTLSQP